MSKTYFLLGFILLLSIVQIVHSTRQVTIEFLYWDPSTHPEWCPTCEPWILAYEDFLRKNETMQRIQHDYAGQVLVNWSEYYGVYGQTQANLYNINQPNSLVIKSEEGKITTVQGVFNETYIRETINVYLEEPPPPAKGALNCHAYDGSVEVSANIMIVENGYANSTPFTDYFDAGTYTINATWNGTTQTMTNVAITNGTRTTVAFQFGSTPPPPPQTSLMIVLASAFTFGFFETFSPCLIALLSFVLSYTLQESTRFKEAMLRIMIFGVGFVLAALLLGIAFGLVFLSMPAFSLALTSIVCAFALIFGLDLLISGVLRLRSVKSETKPLVKKLTRKYAFTYAGLFLLGFVFYFLDPCIAPIFVPMAYLLLPEYLALVLLVFCVGVIVPFICIGILAGSISKLARSTYKYRSIIRVISGLILIGYALYLIVVYVIL